MHTNANLAMKVTSVSVFDASNSRRAHSHREWDRQADQVKAHVDRAETAHRQAWDRSLQPMDGEERALFVQRWGELCAAMVDRCRTAIRQGNEREALKAMAEISHWLAKNRPSLFGKFVG